MSVKLVTHKESRRKEESHTETLNNQIAENIVYSLPLAYMDLQ